MALCLVGVGLGRIQSQARNRAASDSVTQIIRTIYEPIGYGFSRTSDSASDFFGGLLRANELTEENARLRAEAISASLYDEQVKRYDQEVKRLRALIELPDVPGKTKLPALVNTWTRSLLRSTT